ncbi:MAG: hypothetical protein MZV63_51830 [Marinilabiliales bacterium]|nr:hypothetical protein [Marinilabiliales bacterium]
MLTLKATGSDWLSLAAWLILAGSSIFLTSELILIIVIAVVLAGAVYRHGISTGIKLKNPADHLCLPPLRNTLPLYG